MLTLYIFLFQTCCVYGTATETCVGVAHAVLLCGSLSKVMVLATELDAQALWVHRKHDQLGHVFGLIPAAVQAAQAQFDRALAVMVGELAPERGGGAFLLGAEFSAADILFVHCLDWARSIGWSEQGELALRASAEESKGRVGKDEEANEEVKEIDEVKEIAGLAAGTEMPEVLTSYLARCRARPAYKAARFIREQSPLEDEARNTSTP